jgi:hypothetical protein
MLKRTGDAIKTIRQNLTTENTENIFINIQKLCELCGEKKIEIYFWG